MKKVCVVLPTFNEKDSLEKFVYSVLDQEKRLPGWRIDILIADSASVDGTAELAKKLSQNNSHIHFISVGPGLGVGLVEGHRYCIKNFKPDVLAQLDADGQVDASVLPRLVLEIKEGINLIIGSRFIKGGKNDLSLSRKVFSIGSSLVSRIIMGPIDIHEFNNSARAFTPELFQKINFQRLPWREKSFIVQPAFLNEALLAGAKYKEVPIVFKNRYEGYSKNKIINYIYDIVTYSIDVRLHKWGIDIPFFSYSKRAKTLIKFSLVGATGTVLDFIFYNFFIGSLNISPASAKGFSTEIAIINNFTLNNFWTFRHRKNKSNVFKKFGTFNLVSIGGLIIAVLIIKILHVIYGDGKANIFGLSIAYYNIYFFVTILPVMIWNFTVNHFVTWGHKKN